MAKKEETKMTTQGTIITGVIIVIAIFFMFSIFSAPGKSIPPTNPDKNVNMILLMDDDAIKGDIGAPITIVEFSDFECPYCKVFYDGTYQQLKQKYIDTGIVKFVFRDFPLPFHDYAQKSAEAAECAGEQDKYYEMHDKIFELGFEGGIAKYKEYAKDLNLDSVKFDECLDSGKMAIETAKDMTDGQIAGITGTPAFFVNGVFVSGAQPLSVFDEIIQEELKK